MKIKVSGHVSYNPDVVSEDEMSNLFTEYLTHDGGGSHGKHTRDEYFYGKCTREELSKMRKIARKIRRRKGVDSCVVSIDD